MLKTRVITDIKHSTDLPFISIYQSQLLLSGSSVFRDFWQKWRQENKNPLSIPLFQGVSYNWAVIGN